MTANPTLHPRQEALYTAFTLLIETFEKGLISSRGLAQQAEKLTTPAELADIDDELLNHTFWALRHLMQRPACWAPKLEEISYILRCLHGEETFSQEVADNLRH